MKFDLSQYKELDRNELIVQSGGYYGTGNVYVSDAYVYANASQYYRNSVNRGTQSRGSTNGYVSTGGGVASSVPVTPVGYLVQTTTGHIYVNADGKQITVTGYLLPTSTGDSGMGAKETEGTFPNEPLPGARVFQKDLGGLNGPYADACAFFSGLYAVENEIKKKTGQDFFFSATTIAELKSQLNATGALVGNRVESWNKVLQAAIEKSGHSGIAATYLKNTTGGQSIASEADFTILTGLTPGGNDHFQLGNVSGTLVEDPWQKNDDRVQTHWIHGSVIFTWY